MLNIHELKTLYDLKEGTRKIADTYPELNLSYCLLLLERHTEILEGCSNLKHEGLLKRDVELLDKVIQFITKEELDIKDWGCIVTDNLGTYTFCDLEGRGFSIYTDGEKAYMTGFSVLSEEKLPFGIEADYDKEK